MSKQQQIILDEILNLRQEIRQLKAQLDRIEYRQQNLYPNLPVIVPPVSNEQTN